MVGDVNFRDTILKASRGVTSYLGDFLLFMILYGVESSFAGYGSRANGRAYARATNEFLAIKEATALRSLENLKRKGYIRYARGKSDIEITASGRKRLDRLTYSYEEKRKWDGRLYMITYDVPESKKPIRDLLRTQLKKLGCGMLQASVWVTPYDPREVLREFVNENHLEGEILISFVGKESSIAGVDFRELLAKVYRLDELNNRYQAFLHKPLEKWSRYQIALEFYSILREDPQLPFSLLPDNWLGDKAYKRVSTILS